MAIINQKIDWRESIQYDTGGPNAVVLDNNGNAVEVHVGSNKLYYRVGKVDFANQTIAWGESLQYDTGGPISPRYSTCRCATRPPALQVGASCAAFPLLPQPDPQPLPAPPPSPQCQPAPRGSRCCLSHME
jgi:hypothetical protein